MAIKPTPAQDNIYRFVESGTGNGIIDAVAGAGKTTTLMGCVEHIRDHHDALFCAFNRSIRKEIQRKFQARGINVAVKTNHALGLQILHSKLRVKLNENKYRSFIDDEEFFKLIEPHVNAILAIKSLLSVAEIRDVQEKRVSLTAQDEVYYFNKSLHNLECILKFLLDINDKFRLTLSGNEHKDYEAMCDHFGIFEKDSRYEYHPSELPHYIKAHQIMLNAGNAMAQSQGIIDFVDMLYLPHLFNLDAKVQYGFVFVDECQDLSRAQIEIVQKYVRPGGRVLAVGDPYQSIYGFAGADSESFDRVMKMFNCQRLYLTDCFRCPTKAIEIAKTIREDIKGFKTDPGNVMVLRNYKVLSYLRPGDLVICRTRDPLRALAMKLVNNDIKVHMHPDEVDEFIGDYKAYFRPADLRKKLTEENIESFLTSIEQRNIKRFYAVYYNIDPAIKAVRIEEATKLLRDSLTFFRNKFIDWQLNTIDSILVRLKETLQHLGDDAIKISTIHRAKGLENDRVFILEYNKLPMQRNREWEQEQELNLHYVAVTRPINELFLCIEQDEENEVDEKKEALNQTVASVPQEQQPTTAAYAPTLSVRADNFIKILPVTAAKNMPSKFYQFGEVPDTPFHGLVRPFQKAKFWAISEALEESEYAIENIACSNYLDTYILQSPNGQRIYDGHFKASGSYHFTPREAYQDNDVILPYLNDESNYPIQFEYEPKNEGFVAAHSIISAGCKDLGILNTNIFKEGWNMVYCLKTVTSYAYLKLAFNGSGRITTLMPFSTQGKEDTALNSLLEIISHLWQR